MKKRREVDISTKEKVIESIKSGISPIQAAKVIGVNYTTVYRWAKAYEKSGKKGLKNKERTGRPRIIDKDKLKKLVKAIEKPASKFGFKNDLWNCSRVRMYCKKYLDLRISKSTINRRLLEANLSYKIPEKAFVEANVKLQKDCIENHVPKILGKTREKKAVLYFVNEASISLSPMLGKLCAQ